MKTKLKKAGMSISQEIEKALSAPRKEAKIRITTMIDLPVCDALKVEAEKMGVGYQTLINMILKEHVMGKADPFENFVNKVKEEMETIKQRMEKIEKKKPA
jgi:predicted DNA binding CopG/RHH family protein